MIVRDDGDVDGNLWMCGWCLRCRYGEPDRTAPRWRRHFHLTRPVQTWHRVILLDRKGLAR